MPISLPVRNIGADSVTAIGYGAMGIAAFYGPTAPEEERLKFLDDLYASGCTNWDTANIYGDSEVLLGKWFKRTGKRDEIFLATKGGSTGNPERPVNGEPEYITQCVERSLARLGVDHIDLYYLHRPDSKTPIEKTVGALADLVKAGKIRYIGLSECTPQTISRAHAVHPVSAIQIEYSIFALDIEEAGVLKVARELEISIVAYSPLGRGMLTGRYKSPDDFAEDDFRRTIPRFTKEKFPRILSIVNAVSAIGKRHDATPGQIALAWLLAQGEDIIPIPGTRKQQYLLENLGAFKVKLTEEDVAEIRKLAENAHKSLPSRYAAAGMSVVLVDTPPLED